MLWGDSVCDDGVSSHSPTVCMPENLQNWSLIGMDASYPGFFVDFKQNNSGIRSRPLWLIKTKIDKCSLSSYLFFFLTIMLWGTHNSLFIVFSTVFSSLFTWSIVSLLLIVSCCFPPLACSLLSHSVQVEATCCPSRSRSVRLQWQVSRWQLGSIAKAPNYVNLTLAARKQAEKKMLTKTSW